MKNIFPIFAILAVVIVGWLQLNGGFDSPTLAAPDNETLASAIRDHTNGVQVTGEGTVTRILPDDTDGSRHQRFILGLVTGQTLLVAHNVDVASRVTFLERGDLVEFSGVYEWNPQGGVVHWTHHDPNGQHAAGWLKHNGRTFQ